MAEAPTAAPAAATSDDPSKLSPLVWAKQSGEPWWPAEVVTDFSIVRPDVLNYKHPTSHHLVWFFVDETTGETRSFGWVDNGPKETLPFRSSGFKVRAKAPPRYRDIWEGVMLAALAAEKERGGPTAEELAASEAAYGGKPKAAPKKRARESVADSDAESADSKVSDVDVRKDAAKDGSERKTRAKRRESESVAENASSDKDENSDGETKRKKRTPKKTEKPADAEEKPKRAPRAKKEKKEPKDGVAPASPVPEGAPPSVSAPKTTLSAMDTAKGDVSSDDASWERIKREGQRIVEAEREQKRKEKEEGVKRPKKEKKEKEEKKKEKKEKAKKEKKEKKDKEKKEKKKDKKEKREEKEDKKKDKKEVKDTKETPKKEPAKKKELIPETEEEAKRRTEETEVAWIHRRLVRAIERNDIPAAVSLLALLKDAPWGPVLEHLRDAKAGVTLRRLSKDPRPAFAGPNGIAARASELEALIKERIMTMGKTPTAASPIPAPTMLAPVPAAAAADPTGAADKMQIDGPPSVGPPHF